MSTAVGQPRGASSDPISALTSQMRSLLDAFSPFGTPSAEDFASSPPSAVDRPREKGGALTSFLQPLQQLGQLAPQIKLDIIEKPEKYVVHAEMPGVKKDDIRLNVEDGVLTISAEKRDEHEEQRQEQRGWRTLRREIAYGTVTRAIRLPPDAKADAVNARFQDGVLEVDVPRAQEKMEKSNVEIQ